MVTPAHTRAEKRKPATHTVTIDATRFSPEKLPIKAGDTVVWINKDLIPHTASSMETGVPSARFVRGGLEAGGFDSGTILAGESWRHTFKRKGEVPYTCLFHPS